MKKFICNKAKDCKALYCEHRESHESFGKGCQPINCDLGKNDAKTITVKCIEVRE